MRTINQDFATFGSSVLLLGMKGDSNATKIIIDCAAALAEYSGTTAALSIKAPDGTVYPGDISVANGIVTWNVAARDCSQYGHGSARIDLVNGNGIVVASEEAATIILKTHMTGIAPSQISDWTDAASVALQEVRAALLDIIDTNDDIEAAEAARVLAETGRVSAEQLRASAETARATAETSRATAETSRATAETARATAETARASAETARASAETSRASAEQQRVSEFTTMQENAQGALSYVAPSEDSSTASMAHARFEDFIYNGKLMKATTNIAQGDAIVPHTSGMTNFNCMEVPKGLSYDVYNVTNTANAAANNAADAQKLVASLESFAGMPAAPATKAHATGSYFVYGGVLCEATADIAIGDHIVTTGTGANAAQVPGGAMGEVEVLSGEVADLESAVNLSQSAAMDGRYDFKPVNYVQGVFRNNQGITASDKEFVTGGIHVNAGDTIYIDHGTLYLFCAIADENNTIVEYIAGTYATGVAPAAKTYIASSSGNIYLSVRNAAKNASATAIEQADIDVTFRIFTLSYKNEQRIDDVESDIDDIKSAVKIHPAYIANPIVFNTEGKGINADTGGAPTTSHMGNTGLIDISDCSRIIYPRVKLVETPSTKYGIAFYDQSETYISGVRGLYNQQEAGYVYDVAQVPEGAVYVRLCKYLTVTDDLYLQNPDIPVSAIEDGVEENSNAIESIEERLYYNHITITDPRDLRWIFGTFSSSGNLTRSRNGLTFEAPIKIISAEIKAADDTVEMQSHFIPAGGEAVYGTWSANDRTINQQGTLRLSVRYVDTSVKIDEIAILDHLTVNIVVSAEDYYPVDYKQRQVGFGAIPVLDYAGRHTDTTGFNQSTLYADSLAAWRALPAMSDGYITETEVGAIYENGPVMYKYTLVPPNQSRSGRNLPHVFIVTSAHGHEKSATYGLYYLIRDMIDHPMDDPILYYLRNHVRFTIMPMVNPYGWDANSRKNENDVNLNRNWATSSWHNFDEDTGYITPGAYNYRGTAPFSEIETQYIRDALISVAGDVSLIMDVHTNGLDTHTPEEITTPSLNFTGAKYNALKSAAVGIDQYVTGVKCHMDSLYGTALGNVVYGSFLARTFDSDNITLRDWGHETMRCVTPLLEVLCGSTSGYLGDSLSKYSPAVIKLCGEMYGNFIAKVLYAIGKTQES